MSNQTIIAIIYALGIISWIILWAYFKGFEYTKSNRALFVPFLLVIIVLCIEIIGALVSTEIPTFKIEEQLLQVIEANTRQLIMAIFGILVLAATVSAFQKKQLITRSFFLYQMLSMGFIVGGVMPLYWLPLDKAHMYQILRHFKTVFYIYSIGYFLGGLIIIVKNLMDYFGETEHVVNSNESSE